MNIGLWKNKPDDEESRRLKHAVSALSEEGYRVDSGKEKPKKKPGLISDPAYESQIKRLSGSEPRKSSCLGAFSHRAGNARY
jgi:hypothetical protein